VWLIQYNDLINNLVVSDLKVRYQNSILGFAWSMLNPLLMMLILYFVFKNIFTQQPYFAQYIITGIIVWRFFANTTTIMMHSIVDRANLITKIYIPRHIFVFSSALSNLITSTIEFIVLIILLTALGTTITSRILLIPLVYLLYFILVFGIGLALSALYVYFRDLSQIWEVLLQMGFFLSPIVYPLTTLKTLPPTYLTYYMLNPITRIMEAYRSILIYNKTPTPTDFIIISIFSLTALTLGWLIFSKLEPRFAENI